MKKTLQNWVDEIAQVDLPVIDQTLQSLNGLRNASPDTSGAKIAAAVLTDPMMVLKAMRMANSGRSGRFSQPILTIEHAVMMVGFAPSFDKLTSCQSMDATLAPAARAGLYGAAARACHAAYQARDWAVQRLDMNIEEVYIAAQMQELAAMAMWVVDCEIMQELTKLYRKSVRADAEQELLGFGLDDLTLVLANTWNLPPLIQSALIPAECEAHPRSRLVALARDLARDAERGWYDESLAHVVARLAETLRVQEDEAVARIHRIAVECARTRPFEGVTPAAAWLPMLPGEWPEDEPPPQVESTVTESPTPPIDPYEHAMSQIAAHMDGTMTLNHLMKLVLQGMQSGVGLNRVVFALLTQDRKQLRARFVIGAGEGSALRQFQFDLAKPNLFSKLLEKQQAFWLNAEMRPKVERLLDPELRRITASEQFFAMSIAVHGKVIGLLYGDAGEGVHVLSADGYDRFKKLCMQASAAMAHLAKS